MRPTLSWSALSARPDQLPRPTERWHVERAAKRDETLPPIAMHLILDLCTYLDPGSTRIPYTYTPSITKLCRDTGWSRRTVTRWLAFLEATRWLVRIRPAVEDARKKHARTAYTLLIPEWLGTQGTQARDPARPGLGTQRTQARDPARPELGPASPEARATPIHYQTSPDQPDQPDPVTGFIARFFADETGHLIPMELAEEIGRQILARPSAIGQDPLTHVRRTLATDRNHQRWLQPLTKEDDPA